MRRPPLDWAAASVMLVAGVALVASAAIEGGPWWLSLIGYLCLFFVPPMVIDAAAYRLALRARAELARWDEEGPG